MVPTNLGANFMSTPTPPNGPEAAYAAYAIVNELIDLLVTRGVIDIAGVDKMFESVTKRLASSNNFESNRAAEFVARYNK
jgi:hypothetical protein